VCREPRASAGPPDAQAGFTLVEMLVTALLGVFVAAGAYQMLESSRRSFVHQTDLTSTRSTGRAALEIFASDARVAGYSPLGRGIDALPTGSDRAVRRLADLDRDGLVNAPGDIDEDVTWRFVGPDGGGRYALERGVDLDGDGAFTGTGESGDTLASRVVPIDADGDGAADPFLVYQPAPPATTRIRVTFGIQTEIRSSPVRAWTVVPFQTDVALRNRLDTGRNCEDP
jgi:prepilin-type N-terminal cleavage/methylation domain-containing protein